MRVSHRPSLPAIVLSLLAHAGAVVLALSGATVHVRQRPEPAPIEVTLLAPEPPVPAPVVRQAPPPEPAPMPQPVARPAPVQPRRAPVARRKPVAPSPRPQPPARLQERAAATAPAAAEPAAAAMPPAPAATPAPPPAPAPVRTGVSISASYAASNRPPVQPPRSLRNNEEGKVVLRVLVQADGSAGEVQVRSSSGFPLLDEAARSAVQAWRFNPATSDGKPVAEWYLVPIIFKLSN